MTELLSIYTESFKNHWAINIIVGVLAMLAFNSYMVFNTKRSGIVVEETPPYTEEVKRPAVTPVHGSGAVPKVIDYVPKHSDTESRRFLPLSYAEMMDLPKKDRHNVHVAKDFILNEFLSRDGVWPTHAEYLNIIRMADVLQAIRNFVNDGAVQKVLQIHINREHVNSGHRSPAHNSTIPGASNTSDHMKGAAADVYIDNFTPDETYLVAKHLNDIGAIQINEKQNLKYTTHNHIALAKHLILTDADLKDFKK